MSEKIFVDGMIVKKRENAPDWVICNLSLKCDELVEFMRQHHKKGWCNIDIKLSQGGKMYAELDTWQPTQGQAAEAGIVAARKAAQAAPAADDFPDEDIPF